MRFVFDLAFISQNTSAECSLDKRQFFGVSSFLTADAQEVTVLEKLELLEVAENCKAGACFVKPSEQHLLPEGTIALVCEDPWKEFVHLLRALVAHFPDFPELPQGIHPAAMIHETAHVPACCTIDPFVVIHPHVVVGERCTIGAHAVIGPYVHIGSDTIIEPHAVIQHCTVGNHVVIQAGAKIGSCGFGFIISKSGPLDIPHIGRVRIGSNVRIGANTTIHRGTLGETVIQDGARIDNLVQIAHNVQIGKHVVIAAQTGISGSCHLDDGCMLGGQVGLAPAIHLGAGTEVAAKSGVMRSCAPGSQIAGIPAVSAQQWRRQVISLWRMVSKTKE